MRIGLFGSLLVGCALLVPGLSFAHPGGPGDPGRDRPGAHGGPGADKCRGKHCDKGRRPERPAPVARPVTLPAPPPAPRPVPPPAVRPVVVRPVPPPPGPAYVVRPVVVNSPVVRPVVVESPRDIDREISDLKHENRRLVRDRDDAMDEARRDLDYCRATNPPHIRCVLDDSEIARIDRKIRDNKDEIARLQRERESRYYY